MSNTVFDADNKQLSFNNNITVIKQTNKSGGKGDGDIVRFNKVITINDQGIDAVVTTTLSGATVDTYDSTSSPSEDTSFFQPNLSVSQPTNAGDLNGVRFRIDFYKAGTYTDVGTGDAVTLQNVVVNSYDIDSVKEGLHKAISAGCASMKSTSCSARMSEKSIYAEDP